MEAVLASPQDRQTASIVPYDKHPIICRDQAHILAALPDLDNLRRRSGQHDDLSTDLLLILSRHNSRRRRLVLVLLYTGGTLAAAVIFAERQLCGIGVGLLRAGDPAGDGAVIAPAPHRRAALLAAMDALLTQRTGHMVAATINGIALSDSPLPQQRGRFAASCTRIVRRRLPLEPTFEATLQQRFTPRKRKNLLYYLRTLAKNGDIEFVPHIPLAETRAALLQLSGNSWPVRTPAEIALHCDFLARHPECFCIGIRLKTGTWLSLITGWRAEGVTHMPWQLNHASYKHASLMQVMRTFLLQHECALGQSALSWVGGTVAFRTACEPETCLDLLMARTGLRSLLVRHLLVPVLFRRDPEALAEGSLSLLLPPHRRAALSTQES